MAGALLHVCHNPAPCRLPCTALRQPQPGRSSRSFGRAAQQRLRPSSVGGGGGGAGAAAGDCDRQKLLESIAAHQERLKQYVQAECYAAAAEERDAIRSLELRERQLELAAAAEARAGVLHTIGAVIKHRLYDYRGVIFGYDPSCMAPEEWCQMMRVDSLHLGRRQPFYHVLVDVRDRPNQTCYVAQENILRVRLPREVQHPLVPRLFTRFAPEEGGYVAGPELREAYPADF